MEINLTLSETKDGLSVAFGDPTLPAIPLLRGYAETALGNLFIALRAGVTESVLRTHVAEHQSLPTAQCSVCKLEGRILAGMGRHRPADRVPTSDRAQVPNLAAITKVFESGDTAARVAAREAKIKADLESEAIGIAVAGLATRRQTKVELDF